MGENLLAFLSALWGNTVSQWSGVLGLLATVVGLYYKGTDEGFWFIVAGVVALAISPTFAWFDEHKIRTDLEKAQLQTALANRPYIRIEEVPASAVYAYALRFQNNPQNSPVLPESAYQPAFLVLVDADNGFERLEFHVTHSAGVAARNLRHLHRIEQVDSQGTKTDLNLPLGTPRGTRVLIPGESRLHYIIVPRGTFYPATEERLNLRVVLAVTFSNQSPDNNQYFYKVVLRVRQFPKSSDMHIPRPTIDIESSDEGVVTSPDDLLR